MTPTVVLVPVKAFHSAKVRLTTALSPSERSALAQRMAARVVEAAAPFPVAVVCDDPTVRRWAESVGARVLWRPGHGLNGAVRSSVATLARDGVDRVVVSHGDLPLAERFDWVTRFPGVTLIPDRHDDGTNVACVPAGAGFRFSYGAGSFRRHVAEAHRLGLGVRLVRDRALGWDVDIPADLAHPDPVPIPAPPLPLVADGGARWS